jgi:hypothetical protein
MDYALLFPYRFMEEWPMIVAWFVKATPIA